MNVRINTQNTQRGQSARKKCFAFFMLTYCLFFVAFLLSTSSAEAATLSTLRPTSDGTKVNLTYSSGTTAWSLIDDDPDSADTADYIVQTTTNGTDSAFLLLTDMPSDFYSMSTLEIKAHVTNASAGNDTIALSAQIFQSDETTALTNSVQLSTDTDASGLKTATFTLQGTNNKTNWDGARVKFSWVYTRSAGAEANSIRLNATEVNGTYNVLNLAGTLYTDNGSTTGSASKTIKIAVGTSTPSIHSVTTTTGGAWEFTNLDFSAVSTTTPITIWLDGDTNDATTILAGYTSGGVSSIPLYYAYTLAYGTSTTANVDIANFSFYDNDDDNDILYISSGASTTISSHFTIKQGILKASTTLTITGDYTNVGTFTHNSGEVILAGTSTTATGTMTGTSAFNTLTIGGTGTKTFAANASTTNLTINSGSALSAPAALTINGDFTNNGTVYNYSGLVWSDSVASTLNSWQSVTYGNDLFVAVSETGTGNRVMTSPDGITWTARTPADDFQWTSVAYGNGLFVAVARSGVSTRAMTSPDGINWTIRSTPASNWYGVTYGNGLFVAVSINAGPMTSPDGITWTARTAAAANYWQSVTYGNGLFVAVASTGTGNRVMTSPNGITWTARTSAADNDWQSVTYGNGLFVAVASTGTGNRVMTSPDGITWTARTSVADNPWYEVTYGDGLFVAVANSGTYRVMTSPDGITWTARATSVGGAWQTVTYGNGLFVAVAASGNTNIPVIVSDKNTFFINGNNSQNISGNFTGTSTFGHVILGGSGTKTFSDNASTSNLTINSGVTLSAPTALTVAGNYTNSGTFAHNNGTVTFSGINKTIAGTMTGTSAFSTVTLSGNGTSTFSANASTSNLMINSSSTLVAPSHLTITGNYTNNGTFTHNSGTTTFAGTSAQTATGTLSATSSFYNVQILNNTGTTTFGTALTVAGHFKATTNNSIIAFAAGATTTLNTVNIAGAVGNEVKLRSSVAGAAYKFYITGAYTINTIDVKDSNACPSGTITVINSIDSTGNSCWSISGVPADLIITGILYSDEGQTPITAVKSISLAVGTSTVGLFSTSTDGTGGFQFNIGQSSGVKAGTPILLWLDNDSVKANHFTKASSTVSISALELYQDRVIISHEGTSGTSTTNYDLSFYDSTDDADIQYTASATDSTLIIKEGNELHIKTGKTFAPNGTVTTIGGTSGSHNGTLHLTATSTYTAGGNTYLAGGFSASSSATFSPSTYTLNFTATSTGKVIDNIFSTLGNVAFNGVGGGWSFVNDATTTDFTITNGLVTAPARLAVGGSYNNAGTFTAPATSLTLSGNYTNTGTFTHNSGEVILAGTSTTATGTMTGTSAFNTLTVSGSDTKTFAANASTTNLTINSGATLAAPVVLTVAGDYTNSGTFTHNSGTINFTGSNKTLTGTMTGTSALNDVVVAGTITSSANASTTNLTVNSASTFTAPTYLTIAGNYNNAGTFDNNSGTVYLTGNSKILDGNLIGSSALNDLIVLGSITVNTNASTTNLTVNSASTFTAPTYLTIAGNYNNAGTFTAPATSLTLSGNYTNNGTFTHNSGTVNLVGASENLSGNLIGSSAFNNLNLAGSGTKTFSDNASTSNLTINSGVTLSAPTALTVAGNYTNSGTFAHNSGEVILAGTSTTATGTMTGTSAFNTLTIGGTGTTTLASNASTTNLTISVGSTLVAPSVITISDSLTNEATFNANNGEVVLTGNTNTLSGTTTFNNLTKNATAAATTTFEAGALFIIEGDWSFSGLSSTTPHVLLSSVGGEYWYIDPQAGVSISNLSVKDSYNTNVTTITCMDNCIDSTGNINWSFVPPTYNPTLSSAANHNFYVGQSTTTLGIFTITENATIASIASTTNLRLVIATSTDLYFNTNTTPLTFGGTAAGKVSSTVSYEDNGTTLVIDVTSDFAEEDTLTVEGVTVGSFNTISTTTGYFSLQTDGNSTGTPAAIDDKTVRVTGSLTLANHTVGQVRDKFNNQDRVNTELFAFSLTPDGESATVTDLVITISDIKNLTDSNLVNLSLYKDNDSDGDLDGGDTQIDASGILTINGAVGAITFSTDFSVIAANDYLVVGDTVEIDRISLAFFDLETIGVTAVGQESAYSLPVFGDVSFVRHNRSNGGGSGGGSPIGGDAPAGAGDQGGGGSAGGGEVGVTPDGENITPDNNFLPPTTTGSTDNEWTNGSNALASDGLYATAASTNLKQSFTNFSFGIPSGNTIAGIAVKLDASGTTADGTIDVALSWDNGSSYTTAKATPTLSGTDIVYTVGNESDTWGRTWTDTEFSNANFLLRVTAQPAANTVRLDALEIRVFHQAGGGGAGGGGEI